MNYSFDIRPYMQEDLQALYEAASESINEVYPWLPWCHPGYERHEAQDWISLAISDWQQENQYAFVIYETQSKVFVGGCGLNAINRLHGFANLGYWVRSSWTGRGAATQATKKVVAFGFEHLHLHRIEILAAVDNLPSQCVAERSGAVREGVLRKRLLLHGTPHDAVIYSHITTNHILVPTA